MFERRLWTLLIGMALPAMVIVGRLFQLQIIHGADYSEKAEAAIVRAPADLPAVRGRILDRAGRVLASDEPTVDVCIHYGVLAWTDANVDLLARAIRREPSWRGRPAAEMKHEAARRVGEMWSRLMLATGLSREELSDRSRQIVQRVEALRRYITQARRRSQPGAASQTVKLAEENMLHPVIRDVPPEVRAKLEMELGSYPFARLEPAVRRVYSADAAMRPLAHLLGRLGQVSAEEVAKSSGGADDAGRYRPGDFVGTSGVERLAEQALRGRRGSETLDLDGRTLARTPPVDGRDVRITLDAELQQAIYDLLGRAVAENPPATGAACAVLALPSRECLALVSYPSFDPRALATDYARLRDDTTHQPLWPRVIATAYAPGSIIKPATLLAGLSLGRIAPQFQVDCRGQLFPNTNAWHCWTFWNHLAPHGVVDGVTAIQHSCNVFFYTVGEKVGATRLMDGFRTLLYGPPEGDAAPRWRGTGLREESDGLVPSEAGLKRALTPADARNFSIGQGELLLTPLQAANLVATIACGNFLDPTLIRDEAPRTPREFAGIRPDSWRMAREGMYRCANLPGGTAYPNVKLDSVVVCGKTGSAESVPIVTRKRFIFAASDGSELTIEAPTVEAARERLNLPADARPVGAKAVASWPPRRAEGKQTTPTHAWCAAYAPRDEPRIALAVVIEYGGGGGKTAAPVARKVFETLLASPLGYLPRDGGYVGPVTTEPPVAAGVEMEP